MQAYPDQNGNSTWVNFAKARAYNQTMADEVFAELNNLEQTLDFVVSFASHADYRNILPLYMKNATLARIAVGQIDNDGRLPDKAQAVKDIISAYLRDDLYKIVQRMSQIYGLNNATAYDPSIWNEISDDNLRAAIICLGENDGINIDFDSLREHANMFRLAEYVANMTKYPMELREGALQADHILSICNVPKGDEDHVFKYGMGPAMKLRVDRLDSKEVQYDPDMPASDRRELLLTEELCRIDMLGNNSRGSPTAEMLIKSVTPDPNLGNLSPRQFVANLVKYQIEHNTTRHQLAMSRVGSYPGYWPESREGFDAALEIMRQIDPEGVMAISYALALSSESVSPKFDPAIRIHEYITPHYMRILGPTCFNRAVYVVRDLYPQEAGPDSGMHEEAYVLIPKNVQDALSVRGQLLISNMFGGWTYKGDMKADHAKYPIAYDGSPREPPILEITGDDWVEIPLE